MVDLLSYRSSQCSKCLSDGVNQRFLAANQIE